ncbi:MAG: acyltransferase family protein [Candidatus Fimimorpha sp.]
MKNRCYKFDNIRCILIILVVFGHCLELIQGEWANGIYCIIYSFHMPMFIFISGYFARYNRRKIAASFIYPYFVFQIIYQIFDWLVISQKPGFHLQFTYPYWLLWYLFVLILYYLLIPFFQTERICTAWKIVVGSVCLSLLVGFENMIEYYFSLSKFFTFLPYFLMGYYIGNHKILKEMIESGRIYSKILMCVSAGVVGICCLYVLWNPIVTPFVLHGGNTYSRANYGPLTKGSLVIVAVVWIIFFLLIPCLNRKIRFMTSIGQHTISIFLMHGFFVKLLRKYMTFAFSQAGNIALAAIFTVLITIMFGNRYVAALLRPLWDGNWIINTVMKTKRCLLQKKK